uniref:Uncharacterized protein n=1 Tax=Alexandrium monilatum TaxID=311494 RepID=A0A7S4R6T7_9DINO
MCLSGAAAPHTLLWLTCLLGASAKRMHADSKRHVLDSNSTGLPVKVGVQVENDTPYDIEQLVLIHKFNGVDPPAHVLFWDDVKSKTLSSPKEVTTRLGFGFRNDWWMMSWNFKALPGQRCPCCTKVGGSCETWVTDPKNALGQFFLDPLSYVSLATTTVNAVVGIMSLGLGAGLGTFGGSLVVNTLAATLLAGESTSDMMDFGIREADLINWQDKQRPVRLRIKAAWKAGDRVTWRSWSTDIPEGVVGKVAEVRAEVPAGLNRIGVEFPLQGGQEGQYVQWQFPENELRYAFREGDLVTTVGNASEAGQVLGYSASGLVGVRFGAGFRWLPSQQLALHAQRFLAHGEDRPPSFEVEILEWKPPEDAAEEQLDQRGVNKRTAPGAVRRQETIHASAAPCFDDDHVAVQGHEVPVTVVNKATKTIKQWAVVHKFNGLTPAVHVVDSNASLPPGGSSWARPPAPSGSLAGRRMVVNTKGTLVLKDAASREVIARVDKGKEVVARGDAVAVGDRSMVPLEPIGAIPLERLDLVATPDPMAVRTNTGFVFENDWWAIAWSFEGEGESDCEVHTALDTTFLKEFLQNTESNALNIGISVVKMTLPVPVLLGSLFSYGTTSIARYAGKSNKMRATQAAYRLFGAKLLSLLAKGGSTRSYRKCNLSKRDVENAKAGRPVEIEIHDDKVIIRADGGDKECEVNVARKGCLHTEECLATQMCKDLNRRHNF